MYPNLLRRGIATVIDLVVVIALIALIVRSTALADLPWLKVVLAIVVPLMYEPVLSACACTLGQALMLTRVRESETLRRITLRKAYLRFVLKYIVSIVGAGGAPSVAGIPTTVSVFPDGGRRAAHDLQSGTVVVGADHIRKGQAEPVVSKGGSEE
jgi:uncharacterized RDD family membrane protein YckC